MAAKPAAAKTTHPAASAGPKERTGRFDRIRPETRYVEVNVAGYDVRKAAAAARRRRQPRVQAPASTAATTTQDVTPVVFGNGTPPPNTGLQQPPAESAGQPTIEL